MGIYNAMSAAKSGLDGQGQALNSIANNIANINTDAYKRGETIFSTLITSAGSTTGSSNGGVLATDRQLVDQGGSIKSTGRATDLAVSGSGFFVVANTPNLAGGNANYLYTGAGSFTTDDQGNYKNTAGYYLLGWPLDAQGRLPGDAGNINTVSSALLQSLQPVNLSTFTGSASATTQVDIGANLTSSLAAFKGNGVNIKLPSYGSNANIDADTIIDIEHSGVNILNSGDQLSFAPSSVNFTYNFSYDGIADTSVPPGIVRSNMISSLSPIFGADNTGSVFNTGITNGDNFSITNETAGTVTFTFVTNSPNPSRGEFNSMASLSNAIKRVKGLTARINSADNQLLISTIDGNESLTFTDNQGSFVSNLGLTNTLVAPNQNRFTTLRGLLNLTQVSTGLNGNLSGSNGNILEITPSDPTGIVTVDTISCGQINTGAISSPYTIASEFGINIPLGLTNTIPNSGQRVSLGFLSTSTNNYGIAARDVIDIDNSGVNILTAGDILTFASSATGKTPISLTYDGTTGMNGIARSSEVSALTPIFAATTATDVFSTSAGISNGDEVIITVDTTPYTFTFRSTSPNIAAGEFNSMATLAQAINTLPTSSPILSSRINQANNQLLITPLDGTKDMTISDSTSGTIKAALGLNNTTSGTNRFTTLQGLANLINTSTPTSGLEATIDTNNKLQINLTDPDPALVSCSATPLVSTPTAMASIFGEFGISIDQGKSLAPSYDPTGATAPNMASGKATPQFSRNVRIYDAFGTGHDFQISFLKTSPNIWAIEIYAVNPPELTNSANVDGQIAYGNVTFNGDGTLNSVSPSLYEPININWANQAINSSITFNWGTAGIPAVDSGFNNADIGKADGLSQFDAAFQVNFANQNGVPAGQLRSINIDNSGLVSANFSNGTSKTVFQIPLAVFANPNGLAAYEGNAYGQTNLSGEFNLKMAGLAGTGTISPAALEQSNVELSDEMIKSIVASRNFQASAQIIKTSNSMLEEISRIV